MAKPRTDFQRAIEAEYALRGVLCKWCAHCTSSCSYGIGGAHEPLVMCGCDPDVRSENAFACYRFKHAHEVTAEVQRVQPC
jgi:hypothetical protein